MVIGGGAIGRVGVGSRRGVMSIVAMSSAIERCRYSS
jgi:hypothetical protein